MLVCWCTAGMPTERISGRRCYRNDLVIGVSETLLLPCVVCSPKERGSTAPSTAVKLAHGQSFRGNSEVPCEPWQVPVLGKLHHDGYLVSLAGSVRGTRLKTQILYPFVEDRPDRARQSIVGLRPGHTVHLDTSTDVMNTVVQDPGLRHTQSSLRNLRC
jgi:hypothetical protein